MSTLEFQQIALEGRRLAKKVWIAIKANYGEEMENSSLFWARCPDSMESISIQFPESVPTDLKLHSILGEIFDKYYLRGRFLVFSFKRTAA